MLCHKNSNNFTYTMEKMAAHRKWKLRSPRVYLIGHYQNECESSKLHQIVRNSKITFRFWPNINRDNQYDCSRVFIEFSPINTSAGFSSRHWISSVAPRTSFCMSIWNKFVFWLNQTYRHLFKHWNALHMCRKNVCMSWWSSWALNGHVGEPIDPRYVQHKHTHAQE